MRLQGKVLAMQYHAMRLRTASARGHDLRLGRMIVKLQACEINYQLSALAVDVMGELGLLYYGSPLIRSHGAWQRRNMFDLGMIIGGGTAQIQKNIIADDSSLTDDHSHAVVNKKTLADLGSGMDFYAGEKAGGL